MNQLFANSIGHVKHLYDGNTDVFHDLAHSERVAKFTKDIAQHVGYNDTELLELLAYWHDAARPQGIDDGHGQAGAEMARDDLETRTGDHALAAKVYNAIQFHELPTRPPSTEAEILKDADKIDIYSVVRWQHYADEGINEDFKKQINDKLKSIDRHRTDVSFDYSKTLFEKMWPSSKPTTNPSKTNSTSLATIDKYPLLVYNIRNDRSNSRTL